MSEPAKKRFAFSTRDLMWLTLVFAVLLSWAIDHLAASRQRFTLEVVHTRDYELVRLYDNLAWTLQEHKMPIRLGQPVPDEDGLTLAP